MAPAEGSSCSSPFALAMAAAAASFTALVVTEAPATPSISAPFSFTCSSRVGRAAPPTAGVSSLPVIFTPVMALASTVTDTVTVPP